MKQIKVGSRRSFSGTVLEIRNTGNMSVRFDGSHHHTLMTREEMYCSKPLRPKRKRVTIQDVRWHWQDTGVLAEWNDSDDFNKLYKLRGQRGTIIWIPDTKEQPK